MSDVLRAVFWGLLIPIALIGLGAWAFVEAVLAQPAVVGSIATAVVGVFGVLWQQQRSEQQRIREAHRDRMTPVYDELLLRMNQQLGLGEGDGEPSQEMVNFMKDLKGRQLVLGASNEMIEAFNNWQTRSNELQPAGDNLAMLRAWEELLLAIRADLGHKSGVLAPWELLKLFITDLPEHLHSTSR